MGCLVCFDLLLRDPILAELLPNLHGKETGTPGTPLVGVKNHGFLPFFSLSQLIEIFVG